MPLQLVQKRTVDQLDMDPAVLHGFGELAISISLRAAAPGSAYGRLAVNFIMHAGRSGAVSDHRILCATARQQIPNSLTFPK
jgi:hypothetical protein